MLALDPQLILAEATAGPVEAVEVLKAAGVDYVALPGEASPEGVLAKITTVGAALERPAEAGAGRCLQRGDGAGPRRGGGH